MEQSFGPNDPQVRAFLEKARSLSESDWRSASAAYRRPLRWFVRNVFDWVRWRISWTAVVKAGRAREKEAALEALRSEDRFRSIGADAFLVERSLAYRALVALVVRDLIPDRHFRYLYGPFERLIPME
jgi:hypothetical protein